MSVRDTPIGAPGQSAPSAAQERLPATSVPAAATTAAERVKAGAGWGATAALVVGLVLLLAVITLGWRYGGQGPPQPPHGASWRRRW